MISRSKNIQWYSVGVPIGDRPSSIPAGNVQQNTIPEILVAPQVAQVPTNIKQIQPPTILVEPLVAKISGVDVVASPLTILVEPQPSRALLGPAEIGPSPPHILVEIPPHSVTEPPPVESQQVIVPVILVAPQVGFAQTTPPAEEQWTAICVLGDGNIPTSAETITIKPGECKWVSFSFCECLECIDDELDDIVSVDIIDPPGAAQIVSGLTPEVCNVVRTIPCTEPPQTEVIQLSSLVSTIKYQICGVEDLTNVRIRHEITTKGGLRWKADAFLLVRST